MVDFGAGLLLLRNGRPSPNHVMCLQILLKVHGIAAFVGKWVNEENISGHSDRQVRNKGVVSHPGIR